METVEEKETLQQRIARIIREAHEAAQAGVVYEHKPDKSHLLPGYIRKRSNLRNKQHLRD